MARNEEYYNMYEGITNELIKAFLDYFFLEAVDEFSNALNINRKHPGYRIIWHLIELTKIDLGMSVYKVYYDNGYKDTITIQHFNSLSQRLNSSKKCKSTLSKELNSQLENPIIDIRQKLLAHNSTNDTNCGDIPICVMKKAIDEIWTMFNQIADSSIDDRAIAIDNNVIMGIEMSAKLGVQSLLTHITNDSK